MFWSTTPIFVLKVVVVSKLDPQAIFDVAIAALELTSAFTIAPSAIAALVTELSSIPVDLIYDNGILFWVTYFRSEISCFRINFLFVC